MNNGTKCPVSDLKFEFILRFKHVCIEAIGVQLPTEAWSSLDVETKLRPLYERLKLPEGRLELMSGIAERRVWGPGTLPSTPSITSGRMAIDASGIKPEEIGCLIHASVCRDFLEPATASRVHHGIGLSSDCWVYDVSNACLGLLNGAVQIAQLIESGAIRAGLVVGTENSRPLLEQTIEALNQDQNLTRKTVKPAFASLTIGSGSCAWLLTHRELSPNATPFEFAVAEARTEHHHLCMSDQDSAGAGMQPLMETDSETLMAEGIRTGQAAFDRLLAETGWEREQIQQTVCHQVGSRHRIGMLDAMSLSTERDHVTFPKLGNTGSVALPISVASAVASGALRPGMRAAMLGIGSGINSVMLGSTWGETKVAGNIDLILD